MHSLFGQHKLKLVPLDIDPDVDYDYDNSPSPPEKEECNDEEAEKESLSLQLINYNRMVEENDHEGIQLLLQNIMSRMPTTLDIDDVWDFDTASEENSDEIAAPEYAQVEDVSDSSRSTVVVGTAKNDIIGH
jgi:hypothetical protein